MKGEQIVVGVGAALHFSDGSFGVVEVGGEGVGIRGSESKVDACSGVPLINEKHLHSDVNCVVIGVVVVG